MKIYENVEQLIGHTPLVRVSKFNKENGIEADLLVKLEKCNPAGSAKDRVGAQMIRDAEEKDLLKPGATIIEPTSGNTGIGLAQMAIVKGYHLILTMPESMSQERRDLLAAYGAELVLTSASEGMSGAVKKAEELQKEIPGSFIPGQFDNPSNSKAHYLTTGPEIWEDTDGTVDIYVAGIGTGGTLSGTAKFLKEQNKNICVVGVEPADSPVITKGESFAAGHKLQGMGANFVPKNYDESVVDEILTVTTEEAYAMGQSLAKTEGLLVGVSSGAALAAAKKVAIRPENKGKTLVVILPDTGERYLSVEGYLK